MLWSFNTAIILFGSSCKIEGGICASFAQNCIAGLYVPGECIAIIYVMYTETEIMTIRWNQRGHLNLSMKSHPHAVYRMRAPVTFLLLVVMLEPQPWAIWSGKNSPSNRHELWQPGIIHSFIYYACLVHIHMIAAIIGYKWHLHDG